VVPDRYLLNHEEHEGHEEKTSIFCNVRGNSEQFIVGGIEIHKLSLKFSILLFCSGITASRLKVVTAFQAF
jgi:hypothetical protein